jgi:hypothetical protein
VLAILEELKNIGVRVTPVGYDKIMIEPASIVSPELKERLRAHKAEVLAVLKARPATCAASCYEVEPGRWVHHPWDGCKTARELQPSAVQQSECHHCDGAGECSCPACTLRRTEEAVPCMLCRPHTRQTWLAATRPEGCWHCAATGKCGCVSCENGACGVCGGSGKAIRVN